jgi:hypothetical protein
VLTAKTYAPEFVAHMNRIFTSKAGGILLFIILNVLDILDIDQLREG